MNLLKLYALGAFLVSHFFGFSQTVTQSTPCGSDSSLIACYLFDGDSLDGSTCSDDLDAIHGTFGSDRFRNSTSALSLSGSNQYAINNYSKDSFTMDDFSLSMWFKNNENTSRTQSLFEKSAITSIPVVHNSQSSFLSIRVTPNTWPSIRRRVIHVIMANGTKEYNLVSKNTMVCDNNWHHIVLVVDLDNSMGRLYLDTVKIDSVSLSGFNGFYTNNPFSIGTFLDKYGKPNGGQVGNSGSASSFYKGLIDDVKIYTRALDNNAVKDLFLQQQTTSIEEKYGRIGMELWPNPTRDVFNISSKYVINKIDVISVTGTVVLSEENINSSSRTVSTLGLSKGTYFVKAYSPNGIGVKKLMIH